MRLSIISAAAVLVVISSSNIAQEVSISGLASEMLDGRCRSDNQIRGRKDEAIFNTTVEKAKISALRSYSASASISVANTFANKESEIIENIDDYILNVSTRVKCEKGTRDLRVQISGSLNKSAWDRTLALESMSATDRSRMTAMFVARKIGVVTSFDDKRKTLESESITQDSEQGATIGTDGTVAAYGESNSSKVTTVGGKTEQKADVRQYELFANDDLDAAINQGISALGYRVAPVAQISGMPIEGFRDDFATGDVIAPETLNTAFSVLKDLPVNLMFMVATLDVGVATKSDNDTSIVTVSINAQVYRYDGLFFEVVAAVGPEQMRGEGLDPVEAEREALINSAVKTVEELGAQLQSKNIF